MRAARQKGRAYSMNKYLRVFIMIAVLLGTVGLARNRVAWAQPAAEPSQSVGAQDVSFAPEQDINYHDDDGTVKPPPKKTRICKDGSYSLGGVATLNVKNLAPDYCLVASLKKHQQTPGRIPHGAGKILADITVFQVIYRHHHVGNLPAKDGTVELCYAIPPGKNASLYFLNGRKLVWQPLETTVAGGTACAQIRASGSYAMIGK